MQQNRRNNKADNLIAEANNRIQVIKDLSIDSNLSYSRDRQIFSELISRAYELVTQAISISDLPSHYYIRGRYRELGLRFDRSNPNYHPHKLFKISIKQFNWIQNLPRLILREVDGSP